ncbi:polyprotein [Eriophyid mite-associated virus]|nr:polyprotein [Eriophyid mite-associated virus]
MGQTLLDKYRGRRRATFIFHYRDGTSGTLVAREQNNTTACVRSYVSSGGSPVKVHVFPKDVAPNRGYSFDFNTWVYTQTFQKDKLTTEQSINPQKERSWSVVREFTGLQRVVNSKYKASSAAHAKNIMDFQMCAYFIPVHADKFDFSPIQHEGKQSDLNNLDAFPPKYSEVVAQVQMADENMQGEATQSSDAQENTIVTRDEARTDSAPKSTNELLPYVTTEKSAQFTEIVNRWITLEAIEVRTEHSTGTTLVSFTLPKDIFAKLGATPNIIPFEVYLYSHLSCQMKFVVNGNPFQCGKVICSTKFDSFEATSDYNTIQNALTRPHVILDLTTNNEGNLLVPFRFRRALLRNTTHEDGTEAVHTSQYATVYVQVFSQLRTGTNGANKMSIRPMVRFDKVDFAGMSYRAEVQMDVVRTLGQSNALKGILKDVEQLLDTGSNENCDKPTEMRQTIVVPHARMNFPCGKGPTDALVMRMNPTVMTPATHIRSYDSDPKDMLEIARIWGLKNTFQWKTSHDAGAVIATWVVDPTALSYNDQYKGIPTPLEYVCSMYNFWSGTIEMRLDFVSTAFHKGAIMVCVEFGRGSDVNAKSLEEACSTYTQTFHLGDQKSLHVTIPYIYDTIWRRSAALAYNPQLLEVNADKEGRRESMNIRPISYTRVVIRVVNPLHPPETVSPDIDVQVFLRGSSAFRVHSLKQSSMYAQVPSVGMNSFPRDFAEVQMDDGSKEDLDPTDDFKVGLSNLEVQTHDPQTNIKDILRRPTLLLSSQSVEGVKSDKTMGLFIPLMPPSRLMSHVTDKNTIFSEMVGQTPAAAILNMFRFWRGSMRYTIVVTTTSTGPIYVTHVPHTGTRIVGNQQIGDYTHAKTRPIYACGLTTEMIIPRVNTTATIEVPYDTVNNWTLTFEDDPNKTYTWRDKGDTNAGHLVISSQDNITVDVWWSAGDDFQVANFYGPPSCVWDDTRRAYTDEKAEVQMEDFRFNDVENLRSNISLITSNVTPRGAMVAAASALPVVGPFVSSLATQATLKSLKDRTAQSLNKADTVMEETLETLASVRNHVGPIGDSVQEVLDLCKHKLEGMFDGIVDATRMSTDLLNSAIISFYSKSYLPLVTTLVNFLKDFAITQISLKQLQKWINKLNFIFTHVASGAAETQGPSDPNPTMVGVLIGMIGVLFGVHMESDKYENTAQGLGLKMTSASTFTYLNGVLVYVQRIYTVLVEAIKDALGLVDPEVAALRLITENSEFLRKFVAEAQILTNEAMRHLRQTPDGRTRYFLMTLQALQIQRALVHTKGNAATVELSKFIAGILKKTEEHRMDLTACPIKKVPFIFTIEGPSGIGKSHAVHDLLGHLHDAIGIKPSTSGMAYTYQSGSAYWTNYSNQQFILMDDYGQRTNAEAVQAETDALFNLCTDAPYTPPMAHLEDKRMYANPVGVLLLTNNAFASHLTNASHCDDAYKRRRGHIFKFSLKPEYAKGTIEDIPSEILANYEHLEVRMCKSPASPETYEKVLSYAEFKEYCGKLLQVHHERESTKQAKRLKDLYERINGASVSELNFQDPYALFSEKCIQDAVSNGQAPVLKEVLAQQARETIKVAEKSFEAIVREYNTSRPQNPFVQMGDRIVPGEEPPKKPTTEAPSLEDLIYNPPSTWAEFMEMHQMITLGGQMGIGVLIQHLLGSTHNCAKCKAVYGCAYKCGETQKYICEQCYVDENKCPICNKKHARVANAVRWFALFALCLYLIDKGCAALSYLPKVGWIFTIYRYTMYVSMAFLAFHGYCKASHEDLLDDHLAQNTASSAKINIVEAQLAESWPDPRAFDEPHTQAEPRSKSSADPWLDVNLCEEAISNLLNGFVDSRIPCRHCHLIENVESAVFVGGDDTFRVPIAGPSGRAQFLNVPLHPCNDTCPMSSRTAMVDFCDRYMTIHKADIRALYLDYVNYPENRACIRAKLPSFVIPPWMEEDIPIPNTWWDWLTDKWSKYGKLIKILGGVAVVIGVLIKLTSVFTDADAEEQFGSAFSGSSEKSYYPRTAQKTFAKSYRQKFEERAWAEPQSATGSLMRETASKVFRNQVLIKIVDDAKTVRTMGAIGLRGRNVVMPLHYYRELRRAHAVGKVITIERSWARSGDNNHTRRTYTFSEADFAKSTETDLCVMHLPESFPLFADLTRLLMTQSDANAFKACDGVLVVPNLSGEFDREIVRVECDRPQPSIRTIDVDRSEIITRHVIPYNFSEKGACGSVLLTHNPLRPIAALHTCGVPNGPGFGVILTQELVSDLLLGAVTQMEEKEYCEFEEVAPTVIYDDNVYLNYLGAVPQSERPYMQKKSKIEPTPLHNKYGFESHTAPAILDAGDPRWKHAFTPLYHGVKNHGVKNPDFRSEDILEVEDVFFNQVIAPMRPAISAPQRLTPEEAVVGLPDEQFYDTLKLTTSAGYPWVKQKSDTSKLAWIHPTRNKQEQIVACTLDEKLQAEILRKESLRKRGIVPHTIFCDTLKDERRKPQKLEKEAPTRVFCASPVDYTIAMRQNYLHFCAAMMKNRITNHCAVGVNPLGPEWSKIAHGLHNKSATNVFSLDYSNFGPGFHATLCKSAMRIMARWNMLYVQGVDKIEMETIAEEVVNSMHIAQGTIYQQMAGSPSGASVTAIINSIVNMLYLLLAWKELSAKRAWERKSELWAEFFNHVAVYVYGDDLIGSVSEDYCDVYGPQQIISYLAKFGMAATDASKVAAAQFKTLGENSFLKRGFLPHPEHVGLWLAPLEWKVIEEIPQWKHKGMSDRDALEATSYTALLEAHGHGRVAYEGFLNKINAAMRRARTRVVQHSTWDDIDKMWFDGSLITRAYSSLPPGVRVLGIGDIFEDS